MTITAETPVQEIARRELARRHFVRFIEYVDQRFNPMPPHVPKIADELQKVVKYIETGEGTPFLILAMPPRHLKTTLVADLLPAWFLGRNPSMKVIDTTYAATLAYDSSKRVRQMIETSERYANIFGPKATFLLNQHGQPMPSVDIKQDSRAMDKWVIDKYGGEFLAVGVGGPVTGRGGNCFVAGTMVETDHGALPIELVRNGTRVLSYNHGRCKMEYRRVLASKSRVARNIATLESSGGHSLTGTTDHPIFVPGKGYIALQNLRRGDRIKMWENAEVCNFEMCSLWKGIREAMVRICKILSSRPIRCLLFKCLFKRSSFNEELTSVPTVRKNHQEKAQKILLNGMHREAWNVEKTLHNKMFLLQKIVSSTVSFNKVLFYEMQKRISFWKNERREKSELPTRNGPQRLSNRVLQNARQGNEKIWKMLRCLRNIIKNMHSSSGLQSKEQFIVQSCGSMSSLSHCASQLKNYSVSCVTPIEEERTVYDIQVEGTHNFFANGILVHNCIIVDDPLESRADAESKVKRDNVWEYFRSTLWTRREKNAAMIIIMQLWHEDDLVGRIKRYSDPQNAEYIAGFPVPKVISLPAIAEKGDWLMRKEGEALWPQFMEKDELMKVKNTMGDYYFNAQYQQRCSAPEGNIFRRNWFPVVPKVPIEYKIQYWDTAEKKDEQNDYWAGSTIGVTKYGLLLLDVCYRKMTAAEGCEEITRFFHAHNTPEEPVAVVYVEAKSSGSSVVSFLQSGDANLPIEEDVPKLDKVARANGVAAYCKARRLQLLQYSPWIQLFLDEMCSFPTGAHDDLCLKSDTPIYTNAGWKIISFIKEGEYVWTRKGFSQVLWCKKTGHVPVMRIVLTNGRSICATPNHPFYVEGKGFVRLDSIVGGDKILAWSKEPSLMALHSDAIRRADMQRTDVISKLIRNGKALLSICTGMFGKKNTEEYQKECRSITKTETQQTISSTILNYSPSKSTENFIHRKILIKCFNVLQQFARRLLYGINLKREKNGIESMEKNHGLDENTLIKNVQNAGISIRLHNQTGADVVPVAVLTVDMTGTCEDVWNMEVEGEHEYMTWCGIVHNCDSVVGGLSKLVHGGHTRMSDHIKRAERSSADLPYGSEKREKLFGRDGKGSRKRRVLFQGPQ